MKNLIAFIESHDGCAVHGMRGGLLRVSSYGMHGGNPCTLLDCIPPTMRAVRDWLGY